MVSAFWYFVRSWLSGSLGSEALYGPRSDEDVWRDMLSGSPYRARGRVCDRPRFSFSPELSGLPR